MKLIPLLLFLLSCTSYAHSQETFGLSGSNFSGINSAIINPSNIISSKLYADFNLVSGALSGDNNYIYINKDDYNFINLIKGEEFLEHKTYGDQYTAVYDYDNRNDKQSFLNVRVNGPSFMHAKDNNAFGFFSASRTLVSVRNIPYSFAKLIYSGSDYYPFDKNDISSNDIKVAGMSWMEMGLSWAHLFEIDKLTSLASGISVKALFGLGSLYMHNGNIDFNNQKDSVLTMENIDLEYGYSLPLNNHTNKYLNDGKKFRGNGLGFDIGFTYIKYLATKSDHKYRNCKEPFAEYEYKIGFSIMDIGRIKYKSNAEKHNFTGTSTEWNNIENISYSSLDNLTSHLNVCLNDTNEHVSLVDNEYSMSLPTVFSFQIDYRYKRNIYVNAVFINSLNLGEPFIKRPSQFAIIPRYESPNLEFSMPLSLYNIREPRIGLAIRLGPLTLGTDKLGAFFGLNHFTGIDFYTALKFNFVKGKCYNLRLFRKYNNKNISRSIRFL